MTSLNITPRTFKAYQARDLDSIPQLQRLSEDERIAIKAVSSVLPFRVNQYVIEELIDWDNLPNDPIYQLTFPQPGMLSDEHLSTMTDLIRKDADRATVLKAARQIQTQLNPHPAGQMVLNVPLDNGEPVGGTQHKYNQTVLFFPSQGQTCHAYCTYCFRWAQFVGVDELKFASREADRLVSYLGSHPEVSDVLFTGGDPMIMKTKVLRRYIEPLLNLPNLRNIRIGTKALAYWPYRFLTDKDSDDLMKLFEEVVAAGKHLAIMGHYSHGRELDTPVAEEAVRRVRRTGAVVRCQAPLIRHVNDNAEVWSSMWRKQVSLGAIPYYMFVERDTGPKEYFKVPLSRALNIFSDAYQDVSGLGRTVRGPSMSASPGKVLVDGIVEMNGEKYFALKFIQARNSAWVNRIFLAEYDEESAWVNELKPAFGEDKFFYEDELASMAAEKVALAANRERVLAENAQLEELPN